MFRGICRFSLNGSDFCGSRLGEIGGSFRCSKMIVGVVVEDLVEVKFGVALTIVSVKVVIISLSIVCLIEIIMLLGSVDKVVLTVFFCDLH